MVEALVRASVAQRGEPRIHGAVGLSARRRAPSSRGARGEFLAFLANSGDAWVGRRPVLLFLLFGSIFGGQLASCVCADVESLHSSGLTPEQKEWPECQCGRRLLHLVQKRSHILTAILAAQIDRVCDLALL